ATSLQGSDSRQSRLSGRRRVVAPVGTIQRPEEPVQLIARESPLPAWRARAAQEPGVAPATHRRQGYAKIDSGLRASERKLRPAIARRSARSAHTLARLV